MTHSTPTDERPGPDNRPIAINGLSQGEPRRSDEELWRASVGGSEQATRDLLDRCHRYATPLILRFRLGHHLEDILGEAFERVVLYAPHYNPTRPFSYYFGAIVRNICRTHLQKQERFHLFSELGDGLADRIACHWSTDPTESLQIDDLRRLLQLAIAQLPNKQREVCQADLDDGLAPARELADRLGATEEAVRKLRHDGRRRLRELLLGVLDPGDGPDDPTSGGLPILGELIDFADPTSYDHGTDSPMNGRSEDEPSAKSHPVLLVVHFTQRSCDATAFRHQPTEAIKHSRKLMRMIDVIRCESETSLDCALNGLEGAAIVILRPHSHEDESPAIAATCESRWIGLGHEEGKAEFRLIQLALPNRIRVTRDAWHNVQNALLGGLELWVDKRLPGADRVLESNDIVMNLSVVVPSQPRPRSVLLYPVARLRDSAPDDTLTRLAPLHDHDRDPMIRVIGIQDLVLERSVFEPPTLHIYGTVGLGKTNLLQYLCSPIFDLSPAAPLLLPVRAHLMIARVLDAPTIDELCGKGIDIIRWSDDLEPRIMNGLNPAMNAHRAALVVSESQQSPAIDEKGQDLRLVGRLCGWDIDIKTPEGHWPRNYCGGLWAEGIEELTCLISHTGALSKSVFGYPSISELSFRAHGVPFGADRHAHTIQRAMVNVQLALGADSHQLDRFVPCRTPRLEKPLDMRVSPEAHRTAADIVNSWDEDDLVDLIYREGPEHRARLIARSILRRRRRQHSLSTGVEGLHRESTKLTIHSPSVPRGHASGSLTHAFGESLRPYRNCAASRERTLSILDAMLPLFGKEASKRNAERSSLTLSRARFRFHSREDRAFKPEAAQPLVSFSQHATVHLYFHMEAYDHEPLDHFCAEAVALGRRQAALSTGSIPLSYQTERDTDSRRPFIDKKSRRQFEIRTHKRLIQIGEVTSVDAAWPNGAPSRGTSAANHNRRGVPLRGNSRLLNDEVGGATGSNCSWMGQEVDDALGLLALSTAQKRRILAPILAAIRARNN